MKKFFTLFIILLYTSLVLAVEDRIQVPPDSTGKKTRTTTQSIGGHDVHSSVVNIGDPDNTNIQNINSDGSADTRTLSAATVIVTSTTPLISGDWVEFIGGIYSCY